MTFREKLQMEHPEMVDPNSYGGCRLCPSAYGYETHRCIGGASEDQCTKCWNREMPKAAHKPTGHDPVNHPPHYCREGGMESIDEIELVLGTVGAMYFCLGNVLKYRYRAADKNGEEDLRKSDWYMRHYMELYKKVERGEGVLMISDICDL